MHAVKNGYHLALIVGFGEMVYGCFWGNTTWFWGGAICAGTGALIKLGARLL